jgi:hypothetical protein
VSKQKVKLADWGGSVVISLVLFLYLYQVVLANIDLSDGRFALHMDERLTFDSVAKILSPVNWSSFFYHVLDGGDQRYGRSLWNSLAAFSFVPASFFGDTGQIIAARMLQVFLLMSGFSIFILSLVSRWWLRWALLIALLSIPYCDYYMTLPKPEPLQIFFLSLFLHYYKKNNLQFGPHWVLLGIAFGTKISTLPAVFVFIFSSYINDVGRAIQGYSGKVARCFGFFCLGLGAAVPILLPPIIALIAYTTWIRRIWGRYGIAARISSLSVGAAIFLGLGLVPIRKWINATFLNTTHGADNASINFFSWLNYFLDPWLVAPRPLAVFFATILVLLFTHALWRQISSRMRRMPIGLVVGLAGLALNFSIALSAHRLWGMYLFPGTVLVLVGAISLTDLAINQWNTWFGSFRKFFGSVFPLGVLGIVVYISVAFWVPNSLTNLKNLSKRTASQQYSLNLAAYRQVVDFLHRAEISDKPIDVALDPVLFPPIGSDNVKIKEFWGPYVDWDKDTEVLLFSKVHTPSGRQCVSGSPNYKLCLEEEKSYNAYVVGSSMPCDSPKCYRRISVLPGGGEILLLER